MQIVSVASKVPSIWHPWNQQTSPTPPHGRIFDREEGKSFALKFASAPVSRRTDLLFTWCVQQQQNRVSSSEQQKVTAASCSPYLDANATAQQQQIIFDSEWDLLLLLLLLFPLAFSGLFELFYAVSTPFRHSRNLLPLDPRPPAFRRTSGRSLHLPPVSQTAAAANLDPLSQAARFESPTDTLLTVVCFGTGRAICWPSAVLA
jgi:hypothetical protein